jgi:ligand-binding sensor domain-containing protein
LAPDLPNLKARIRDQAAHIQHLQEQLKSSSQPIESEPKESSPAPRRERKILGLFTLKVKDKSLPADLIRTAITMPIQAATRDKKSDIVWLVSENDGLCRYDPQSREIRMIGNSPGEAHLRFNTLRLGENIIWLGSREHGLWSYQPQTQQWARLLGSKQDPNEQDIRIMSAEAEQLWLGTWGSGVWCYNPHNGHTFKPKLESALESSFISALAHDSNWTYLAAWGDGVWRYHRQSGECRKIYPETAHGNPYIKSIACEPQGLILGTWGDGLQILPTGDERWRNMDTNEGLPDNYIRTITAQNGEIWVGSLQGVTVITLGQLEVQRRLTDHVKHIVAIFVGNHGHWIATKRQGLYFWKERSEG